MGSGASSHYYPDNLRDKIVLLNIFKNGKLLFDEEKRRVTMSEGKIIIQSIDSNNILIDMEIDDKLVIILEKQKSNCHISIRDNEYTLLLCFDDEETTLAWYRYIHDEIVVVKSKRVQGQTRGLDMLLDMVGSIDDYDIEEEILNEPSSESQTQLQLSKTKLLETHDAMLPPNMKIVILVVGTRGDVQPFVNLGLELKNRGHTVRVATHSEYRQDVVKEGLYYYPLAGDPRKLSEYMVKTAGRLIPDLLSEEERTQLPEKMQMLRDITFSTWPACTQPDPEDPDQIPFVAEAIISNPVSYGHIHCAEALAIPLHIMFPQPWYPTKCFPHPLSNLGFQSNWSIKNRLSYRVVDEFMWLGLGSIINDFRSNILNLPRIRSGEGGESLLQDLDVPISHMWSPSFVPRCIDWPLHVDVVGDFTRLGGQLQSSKYQANEKLQTFLDSCQDMKPIYIGFGSMVIPNAENLVIMIKNAAQETGYPVILQSGWTKYAEDYEFIADRVMVVGAMPHDWLFQQVSAVIHHGGAGTTSAGLRAGNPTFICPFFGDQHFWGEMVYRSGAGPPGCPIALLTTEKLVNAFHVLSSDQTRNNVITLSEQMNQEKGVLKGVESFLRNLPLEDMICEVSLFCQESRIATVYCRDCGLKMSSLVDKIVHRQRGGRLYHLRVPYRCVKWGVDPPIGLVEGLQQGFGVAAYEIAGGFYDLLAKPIEGARENGATGAAKGVARGVVSFIARPIKGGQILIDRISQSVSTDQVKRNRTVHETLKNGVPDRRIKLSFREEDFENEDSENKDENENKAEDIREDNPNDLTDEENKIESAVLKALQFRELWLKLDESGDRLVNLSELRKFLPKDEAEALLQAADSNNDGELTFAELASNLIRHSGQVKRAFSSKSQSFN